MNHSHQIISFFEENLNEKICHDLCRKHKFIKRASKKIQGHEFIKAMIIPSQGLATDSLKGIAKRIQEFNVEADLSAQALNKRINDASAPCLMKGILGYIIGYIHEKAKKRCSKLDLALKHFNNVYLEDSTTAVLNEKLQDEFKGSGGDSSKAQVKIDFIYELMKGAIIEASIHSANTPDQSLASRILDHLKADDLVIRDLGYFALRIILAISRAGAFFISRLPSNVNIYLNKEDKKPLELGKYLNKYHKGLNIIDLMVYLGQDKVPSRLVIYLLPKEVIEKRRRDANKRAKQTGRPISRNKQLYLQYSLFVTNISKDVLTSEQIGTIYRLRWEIELIFKRWKSQLEIDYLKGTHLNRIECLIWSRLCTVAIIEIIRGFIAKIVQKMFSQELSEAKLIQYLLRESQFRRAVATNKLENYLEDMLKDARRMLLKDKRRRRTMRERVFMHESYYCLQITDNQLIA